MPRTASWSLALVALLTAAAACFSERQSVTGASPGGNAACSIPIGPPIFGSTRALIAIRSFNFRPDTIRIRPGTVVTWINCEPENIDAHTSTSDDQLWDSPFLAPGDSFTRTFPQAGTFDYGCVPHPFMRGVIIVE